MATINNIKGTSYPSFGIGKRGITLYQGTTTPDNANGADGDLYIQKGTYPDNFIFQRRNGIWTKIQVGSPRLDELAAITPTLNYTVGTDGSNVILRAPAAQRSALGLGSAAVLNTGTEEGNIPVLDSLGKLPLSTIPLRAITDVYVVATIEERDELLIDPGLQEGDIVIVTDTGQTFIYDGTEFQFFASASGVQAIQTTDPEVSKHGVVTLDAATDIVTGTMLQERGGTGFATYAEGDILVGNDTNGLSKLELGSNNSVLTVNSGVVEWVVPSASNVSFTPDAANHISSDTMQDAISEVAAERPYLNVTTSNPTVNDDSGDNYKIGDLWINTSSDRIWMALSVASGAAEWKEFGGSISIDSMLFVAANGSDISGDGTEQKPYQTIGQALGVANSGTTIFVYPGTYAEDVDINGLDNISIIGSDLNVVIAGKVTITASTGSVVQNLTITNPSAEGLGFTAGADNILIRDVTVIQANISDLAVLSSSTAGSVILQGCSIKGIIRNSASTGTLNVINSVSSDTRIEASGATTVVNGGAACGFIYHSAGNLIVSNIGTIYTDGSNRSIQSVASTGSLYLKYVSLRLPNGTWGDLVKTGSIGFTLDHVSYNVSNTFTGTRTLVENSDSIIGNYTPNYYTPNNSSITGHLSGIDSKFNTLTFLGLTDVPDSYSGDAGKFVRVTSGADGVDFETASFLDLSDTPNSYAGSSADANKILKVNSSGNAIEFGSVLASVATAGTFLSLTDTPSSYSGQANKYLKINASSNAIEFVDLDIISTDVIEAAGDLIVGTGVATVDRLAIGSNGQVLGVSEGNVTWITPASGNAISTGSSGTLTRVSTNAVAGTVTIDATDGANSKRVANFVADSGATNGESLTVTNDNGNVLLNASGTGDINLTLTPLGNGQILAPTGYSVDSNDSLTTKSYVGDELFNLQGTISALYVTKNGSILEGDLTQYTGEFDVTGDAQVRHRVMRASTTDNTTTELLINGLNRLVLSNDSTWQFEIDIVARRTDVDGESAGFKYKGVIDRNSSAGSTALVGTVAEEIIGADDLDWVVSVDADTTNGALRIQVTGEDAKSIRWVAFVKTIEVIG